MEDVSSLPFAHRRQSEPLGEEIGESRLTLVLCLVDLGHGCACACVRRE